MSRRWKDVQREAASGKPYPKQGKPGFRTARGAKVEAEKPEPVMDSPIINRLLYPMPMSMGMWAPITFDTTTTKPAPPFDLLKLEALKRTPARRIAARIPDFVEVITGWRAWGVAHQQLMGLGTGSSKSWPYRKPMEAGCYDIFGFTARHEEASPALECNCGAWAFKSFAILQAATERYSTIRVLGQVSLWGKVIECENGYRAQFAYPSELWLFDNSLEELGRLYNVPVRTV